MSAQDVTHPTRSTEELHISQDLTFWAESKKVLKGYENRKFWSGYKTTLDQLAFFLYNIS